jgi:Uma2 family endonuclease
MTTSIANTEETTEVEVPEVFIAEYLDGIPMYYKGYKKIINNPSQIEEIMGAGAIHSILLSYFIKLLALKLEESKYWLMTGETGFKPEKKNQFNLDLAIYKKENLLPGAIGYEYVNVAPELVVEIDTSVENDNVTKDEYIFGKTQRLLQFGTGKVVWVFSKTKLVMIALPSTPWQVHPWSTDLELLDDIEFNIDAYCQENKLTNLINIS